MPSREPAQFLADSPDRAALLAHLHENPGQPSTIAAVLSMSHRSVQRNLSRLTTRGWVEKLDGVYQLTTTGTLIAEEHTTYLDSLSRIEAFDDFFNCLPNRELAPDPRLLENATLVTARPENPQAPVHHYVKSVRALETETIRMLSPVLSRLFHDAHATLAKRGIHTELVLSTTMVEQARELNPMEFDLIVGLGILDLYRHPEPVSIGLTLGEQRVLIGAYDEHGQMRACIDSSEDALLAWAVELYERYQNNATPVTPTRKPPFT